MHQHLWNDSSSFHPVHPLIRAFGPKVLHHAKGHCHFNKADLSRANLYGAVLRDCQFVKACLEGVNLRQADLTGINLSMESIGSELLQENQVEYQQYYDRWYINPKVKELFENRELKSRYMAAVEIYLGLKNAFMGSGRYGDASWAYIKERQMERKTYHPFVARHYYGRELSSKSSIKSFQWWKFYFKYTIKWCVNWIADALVGYGERPLRAASWGGITIVFFAFAFWLSGGISNPNGQPLRWIDYFHYSLATFSTIGFPDLMPANDLAKLLTSLEALTGISLLALLMFSLGNRINRS